MKHSVLVFANACWLLLGLWLVSSAGLAQTPFSCTDGVSYRIQGNPSALFSVNLQTGVATQLLSATRLGNRNLQGLGYNPVDNFLYASISGTNSIARIGNDGNVTVITVPSLAAATYQAGDVGPDGSLYLYVPSATSIQKINLTTLAVSSITLTQGANLPDIAISPTGSFLYGISANNGNLIRYPITGGAYTQTTVGPAGAFSSSAYIDETGDLYLIADSDSQVYEVPGPNFPNESSLTKLSTSATAITNTDGARCATSVAVIQTPFSCQPNQAFNSTTTTAYVNSTACTTASGTSTLIEYDLSSGRIVNTSGQLIDTFGGRSAINNLGYNPKDNYLWAYRLGTNQLVRIGQERSVEYFAIPGLSNSCGDGSTPNNTIFLSGDINPDGVMYLLNGIQGDRFIRVDLNPTSPTYLQKLSEVVLSPLKPSDNSLAFIQDIAFNPVDKQLYTVSANNNLVRINPTSGLTTNLGTVTGIGATGPGYVADYFDLDGSLYIKGASEPVYKIPRVATGGLTGSQFTSGPVTGGGDGARCPTAPVQQVVLSGSVLNDGNGLTDNTVNGAPISALGGSPFYVSLVGSAGTVVASTTLTSGAYSFTVGTNTAYTVVLSSTPGTVGSAPPATTLSSGAVNVGENIGTAAGNDGTANGQITVSAATTNITNINFGVDARPVAQANTDVTRPNPGGTATSPVSSTVFAGTDAEDGTYPTNLTGRAVTLAPATGGAVYYNGTAITSTTLITGFNPTLVSVNPTANTNGSVTFPYTVDDNAGVRSDPKIITVPFTAFSVTISGTVFDDGNGLIDNTVNGTGVSSLAGNTLYANLVGPAGTVVASTPLNGGSYAFSGVTTGTSFSVVLSNTPGTVGAAPPSTTLTGGVVNAGENIGTGAGSDGSPNGIITVAVGTSSISNVNFGLDVRPVGVAATDSPRANPGSTVTSPVSSTLFNGTDAEDGTYPSNLAGRTVSLSVATNGTLYYNGTPVTSTTAITNFDPTKVSIDPTATGATTGNDPSFTYSVFDNAGVASQPQRITVPFSAPVVPTSISGSVLNDANGLTDNTVNGTGVNGPALPVYVSLVQGGSVIATVPVTATGSYSFTGVTPGSYSVVLTTNPAGSATASLPTNYTSTAETIGTTAGSDGTPNGILAVSVVSGTPVSDANFGIEPLPTAGSGTSTVSNAGGTSGVSVPANTFTNTTPSSDVTPGSVTSIRITGLSTNTTSLTINGTVYTTSNFPAGGVVVPTDGSGNPSVPILVDPTNDAQPVSIPFRAIDNAGKESTNTGSAVVNSTPLSSISGNVFNDANGLTDNTVNGPNVDGTAVPQQGGSPVPVFVSLVSGSTIVATVPVTSTGTYSFTSVPNGNYSVVLTTNPAGSLTPSVPTSWTNTGEQVGTGAGSDGAPDGSLPVTVNGTAVSGANFGIERLPTPGNGTNTVANRGGTTPVTVPANTFTNTTPSSDITPGSVTSIRITGLSTNTTSLTINGTVYTTSNFPAGGVVVPTDGSGNPGVPILVDPTNDAQPISISFRAIDNAGKESITTGTAVVNFTAVAVPDLTPIIYARSSTVYNTSPVTVVVDVLELLNVATTGLITVKISKEDLVSLTFTPGTTSLDNRVVQNSQWSLDATSDAAYYILITNSVIAPGGQLSFGFSGTLTPGATSGTLTFSTSIVGGSGGEVRINNNNDADKIDYFERK